MDGPGDFGSSAVVRTIIQCRQELGLSDAQIERLDRLGLDLIRELIRRRAELDVAQLDLAVLMQPDANDPAKPAEVTTAEAKIRGIARIAADGDVAVMRTIESAKAVLTVEQRAKLAALLDDPPARAHPRPQAPGGGHHFEGRHDIHRHPQPWVGVRPWVWPDPFWPGYIYAPPPPPAYIAPPASWYYCQSAGAYYPDVQTCPEGWVTVAPRAATP
jgi:hypothetical protein